MQAKGRFYCIKQSEMAFLNRYIALYPLSFSTLYPFEHSETSSQYSESDHSSHILVPRPSAVYASLIRMMHRYRTPLSTSSVLLSDLSELVIYHLLGYNLETLSYEDNGSDTDDDDTGRLDTAISTIQEWTSRKEWAEGEEWMEIALSAYVRVGKLCFPPECTTPSCQ